MQPPEDQNREALSIEDMTEEEIELLKNTKMSAEHDHLNEELEEAPKKKLGIGGILKAISKAVNNDQMSAIQARQIRNDLGIMQSYFTGSQQSIGKKRAKRIAAKKARKVTMKNGYKGQKLNKGKR